jgi:hypothetical protein
MPATSDTPDDDALPASLVPFAARAADEGIPVACIARILASPYSCIMASLQLGVANGTVLEIPRADWPPKTLKHKRLPAFASALSTDDLLFLCRTKLKLTNLEGALTITLLRHERCDKMKLHNVVEQQRFARASQPNNLESSDPKMVDVMICKLRKKLKTIDPRLLIETVWGGGYFIAPEVKDIAFVLLAPEGVTITEVPGVPETPRTDPAFED